jgi:DnaJ-class molecular chaperone
MIAVGLFFYIAIIFMVNANKFFYNSFHSKAQSIDNKLYDVLGVGRQSTNSEIKKAYRKKAMLNHPDRGGNEEDFKVLVEAYEILSNPEKRSNYDKFGMNASVNGVGGMSAEDLASDFFSNFQFPVRSRTRRKVIELSYTLESLYTGTSVMLQVYGNKLNVDIKPGMDTGDEIIEKGLTDVDGNIIDLNGQNWSLTIRLIN